MSCCEQEHTSSRLWSRPSSSGVSRKIACCRKRNRSHTTRTTLHTNTQEEQHNTRHDKNTTITSLAVNRHARRCEQIKCAMSCCGQEHKFNPNPRSVRACWHFISSSSSSSSSHKLTRVNPTNDANTNRMPTRPDTTGG